jgi:hypothetical protein
MIVRREVEDGYVGKSRPMTKEEIVTACHALPLEDMAYVRNHLHDMVLMESSRLYYERSTCKHPQVLHERYGQLEDQVRKVCTTCRAVVG